MMRPHAPALLLAALFALGGMVDPAATQPSSALSEIRQSSEAEILARSYVAAYSAADWGSMAPLMSEDFVFVDLTNPDMADHAFQGRDVALSMFRDFSQQARIIGLFLDFPVVFESQGVVTFSGHVNSLSYSAQSGYGLRWRAEQVTIVTVRDGRVVRHEDYVNYVAPRVTRERLEIGQ